VTDERAATPASEPAPASVARTPKQLEDLVAARPEGWEFLLFAAALLEGKKDLELRWWSAPGSVDTVDR